jgi:hypothetical protein
MSEINPTLSVGALVVASVGTKERLCVVLRVLEEGKYLLVIGGTGTEREKKCVVVEPGSRAGKALELEKKTFFYQENVTRVSRSGFRNLGKQCPPSLLASLLELIGVPTSP